MTETLYTATSEYVEEIKALPVKRRVSVSGILKNWTFHVRVIMHGKNGFLRTRLFVVPF